MVKWWLSLTSLVVLFLAVACGGGGNEAGTPTQPPASTPQPTAEQNTPQPTPVIADGQLESSALGYGVQIPEGWKASPNFLPGPGFSVDAFFAPDLVEGIQPNISITCDEIPEGTTMTLKDYSEGKLKAVRGVAQVEPDVSSDQVGGQEAVVAHYNRENLEPPVQKTDVFLVSAKCGWTITMVAPLSRGSDYQSLFQAFLSSFHLLP